jgi:hypothetical protein
MNAPCQVLHETASDALTDIIALSFAAAFEVDGDVAGVGVDANRRSPPSPEPPVTVDVS